MAEKHGARREKESKIMKTYREGLDEAFFKGTCLQDQAKILGCDGVVYDKITQSIIQRVDRVFKTVGLKQRGLDPAELPLGSTDQVATIVNPPAPSF